MIDQWRELKETITELRDNDGTGTQQEVCKFLANYMGVLEKQMIDPIDRVLEIIDDADKKAGDKTYIVLDDGSFYSQVKYIKEKMLELLEEGGEQG